MRSFFALMRREYLEHRLAYVIAPAVLVVLIALAGIYVWLSAPTTPIDAMFPVASTTKLYDLAYGAAIQGWWIYALVSLFFYYADAFHGDTRNNAMLFWKSMPQSDLKISASKLVTGMSVFPAAIFVAALVSGLVLTLPASVAGAMFGLSTGLDLGAVAQSYLHVSAIGAVYFVVGLLWFAPFFAWVALLSTVLGRWSIPLAFLIPAVVVIFELLVIRPAGAPGGSYVLSFLGYRANYTFEPFEIEQAFLITNPIDAGTIIGGMLSHIDWLNLVGGLVVAAVLIIGSAEYRRRYMLT